ncbi:hypothetical protein ACOSQ3_007906 [Xanthoceras sorbifolium]
MKILEANAGVLTNFEVLNFLQSRGASKDPTRVFSKIAPSEFKVYDYLVENISHNQTREMVNECVEKLKKFKLAKAEVLNIINVIPSSLVGMDSIVEDSESRFGDEQLEELVNLVTEVLPLPPKQAETAKSDGKNEEQAANEEEQVDKEQKQTVEGEIKENNDITADDIMQVDSCI